MAFAIGPSVRGSLGSSVCVGERGRGRPSSGEQRKCRTGDAGCAGARRRFGSCGFFGPDTVEARSAPRGGRDRRQAASRTGALFPSRRSLHQAVERAVVAGLAGGTSVVQISGFTHANNEFVTPYRVINYHACNSCWNDVRHCFAHKSVVPAPCRHAAPVRVYAADYGRAC